MQSTDPHIATTGSRRPAMPVTYRSLAHQRQPHQQALDQLQRPWALGRWLLALVLVVLGAAGVANALTNEDAPQAPAPAQPSMTAQRMGELIQRIDPEAIHRANTWEFAVEDYGVAVVFDETADRMRTVVPIAQEDQLDEALMRRLLQANYDSALDARYAIGQGVLWATFIHPLSTLTDELFLSGVGQTVNIVATFGTSFTSGAFIFGGGDSAGIELQELLEKLKELGTDT